MSAFQATSGSNVLRLGERRHEGKPVKNRLLLAIPDAEYQALRPFLSFAELPQHVRLHEPGENLEFAYFPNRGLISLWVVTRDDRTLEINTVGNEGFTGMAAVDRKSTRLN